MDAGGGGRRYRSDEAAEEEDEGREASWRVMEVSGSLMFLKARSRFLCIGLSQHCTMRHRCTGTNRRSSSSSLRSLFFSEYQGFRSFAEGARGTPFSVSTGSFFFLVALTAADIAFCEDV